MLPSASPSSAPTAHVQALLAEAGQLLGVGSVPSVQRAVFLTGEAVRLCQSLTGEIEPAAHRLLAGAWLLHANALRESRGDGAREAYAQALRHFESVMQPGDPADVNQVANIWTNCGMLLLDEGGPAALDEALHCFDRAIELRKGLPLEADPLFPWGLSAAWINRADVLTRLGQPEQRMQALHSYDEAIRLLEAMPLDEHPTCRARLALAWMNRGLTAQGLATPAMLREALRCLSLSIGQLANRDDPLNPEQRRVLACAHLNRGHALLNGSSPAPAAAREDALRAMQLAAEFERKELLAANMGLQARHLLCRAMAHLVDLEQVPEDWVAETTDAVDGGMALARYWRQTGAEQLQELETGLFRFGATIYRLCQPHFLAEFLLESLDPEQSPGAPVKVVAMHHLATDALWSAVMDIRARQQADSRCEHQAQLLAQLQEFQEAEQRLQILREQHLQAAA